MSENVSLPQCSSLQPILNELLVKFQECANYESLPVEDFSPNRSISKYNYTQCMKNHGFPFPAVFVNYAHGNNVGNLNFVWKVPHMTNQPEPISHSQVAREDSHILL